MSKISEIISLSSSEEEDFEPKKKRIRPTLVLPECTITPVYSKKVKTKKISKPGKIDTIILDGDENIEKLDNKKARKKIDCNNFQKHLGTIVLDGDGDIETFHESENKEFEDNEPKQSDTIVLDADEKEKIHNDENGEIEDLENEKKKNDTIILDGDENIETFDKDEDLKAGNCNNFSNNDEKKQNDTIVLDSEENIEEPNENEIKDIDDIKHIENVSVNNDEDSNSIVLSNVDLTSNGNLISKVDSSRIVTITDSEAEDDENEERSKENTDSNSVINETNEDKEKEDRRLPDKNDNIHQISTSIKPTSSEKSEIQMEFTRFLNLIEKSVANSQFEEVIPKKMASIQKYFDKCGNYVTQKTFTSLLNESISKVQDCTASAAVLTFHKIYEHLKVMVDQALVEINKEDIVKVKKLEKTIKLLLIKIKKLEECEVNFDEESDSAYMQLDRYQSRLKKVHEKYCQYIKKNPNSGRLTYDRINFVTSNHNEINLAINRKFKNSLIFPSYCDFEAYITKVVKKENLKLTETQIKIESERCFKALGNILQKRRKAELYECHLGIIQDTVDPATKDPVLENTLRKSFVVGKENIEKLCQKFTARQDLGEDTLSSGSRTSDDSEDEESLT